MFQALSDYMQRELRSTGNSLIGSNEGGGSSSNRDGSEGDFHHSNFNQDSAVTANTSSAPNTNGVVPISPPASAASAASSLSSQFQQTSWLRNKLSLRSSSLGVGVSTSFSSSTSTQGTGVSSMAAASLEALGSHIVAAESCWFAAKVTRRLGTLHTFRLCVGGNPSVCLPTRLLLRDF